MSGRSMKVFRNSSPAGSMQWYPQYSFDGPAWSHAFAAASSYSW